MVIAFQIILLLLILIFSLASIGELLTEHKAHYTAIALVSIIAICITLVV